MSVVGGGSFWTYWHRSYIEVTGAYTRVEYPAHMPSTISEWTDAGEKLHEYERRRRLYAEDEGQLWNLALKYEAPDRWQEISEKVEARAAVFEEQQREQFGDELDSLSDGRLPPRSTFPRSQWPQGYWDFTLKKQGKGTAKNVKLETPEKSWVSVTREKGGTLLLTEPVEVVEIGNMGPGDSVRVQVWSPLLFEHYKTEFRVVDSEDEYEVSFPVSSSRNIFWDFLLAVAFMALGWWVRASRPPRRAQ